MLRRGPEGGLALHRPRAALVGVLGLTLAMAGCGSSSDDEGSRGEALRVETAAAPTGEGSELIVYVADPKANVAQSADGAKSVLLECLDESGAVLVRGRHPWPFTDTDEGLVDAHVHQPVPQAEVTRLERCRLGGTDGPMAGQVTGPGVR